MNNINKIALAAALLASFASPAAHAGETPANGAMMMKPADDKMAMEEKSMTKDDHNKMEPAADTMAPTEDKMAKDKAKEGVMKQDGEAMDGTDKKMK